MKKLILAAFALTTAGSVFAQGTLVFANRVAGQDINQTTHVYAPLNANDTIILIGLGPNDIPTGTTDFMGRALIGASGLGGQYGASTTYAQLLGAIGVSQPISSLSPQGQISTFRTGTGAGFISQITSTLSGTGFGEGAVGPFTFTVAAWDNSSGLYPTWTEAKGAWERGDIAAGMMLPFPVNSLAGGVLTPIYLTQAGPNLTSFNLYFVPEPSTFALAGLGAAALMIFRRRK